MLTPAHHRWVMLAVETPVCIISYYYYIIFLYIRTKSMIRESEKHLKDIIEVLSVSPGNRGVLLQRLFLRNIHYSKNPYQDFTVNKQLNL